MKKLVLILLLIPSLAFAQDKLSILLYAPNLPDTGSVYIAGSIPGLGNWNPSKVKMEHQGNGIWKKELNISSETTVEYKYTLGSWETEGASATGAPLSNIRRVLKPGSEYRDTIFYWKKGKSAPIITGSAKFHSAPGYMGLKQREFVVWLPPGYEQQPGKRYPVLYMQDGQNCFDPQTTAFGAEWQIDETADSMIKAKSVEPLIIVGIYNTPDRMEEYVPSEKGKIYQDFLVKKLKPFIDSAYRTKPESKYNYIGGSSAGGILAFMMLWNHPDKFSKAICMSPAFRLPGDPDKGWNFIKTVEAEKKRNKVFIYMDNGGVGLEQRLQPGIDEMLKALKNKGYREGRDYIFILDKTAEHNEKAWAKRFPKALELLMKK